MLGRLMSERWWGAWMQQSWRSCEYVRQAGWDFKSMEETAESQRHLYSCITGELLKILLNEAKKSKYSDEAKKTLVLQLLLWNFSGKKGVGAVLAGLWLACTEEFSPISVVSCCMLQSLTLPISIQPLLLRSSFTHGLEELLVAHAAQKSDAC